MKDAAKKASQQNQQQTGQPQPGKKTPTPGQGQPTAGSINDSGPFKPPADTKIFNFLAQGDDSLERITITLSPDTSLATMLGGKTVASNH